MIKLVYHPDGEVVSDFEAEDYVDKLIAKHKGSKEIIEIKVTNHLVSDFLTYRVLQGEIPYNEVLIYDGDILMHIDMYSGLEYMSEDVDKETHLDLFATIGEEILKQAIINGKRDRELGIYGGYDIKQ